MTMGLLPVNYTPLFLYEGLQEKPVEEAGIPFQKTNTK